MMISTEPPQRPSLKMIARSCIEVRERICVFDDNLGRSGSVKAERAGIQKLNTDIGSGQADLVLSFGSDSYVERPG